MNEVSPFHPLDHARIVPPPPNPCSEFAVRPTAVIVHDPVAAGSFDAMLGVRDAETLQQRLLFRALPDRRRFAEQHRAFVDLLARHVGRVHYLSELLAGDAALDLACDNPNQVYTRDALITLPWVPWGYIPGNMKMPVRRREVRTMAAAVERLGLRPIARLGPELYLEGGDVIPFVREGRRGLLVGFGRRTARETLAFLQSTLIPQHLDEIIGVELAPWRINLDGGMVPVASDVVIAHPASILSGVLLDACGERPFDVLGTLRDLGIKIVEVERDESIFMQACNCVCLGDRKLICYSLCERVLGALRGHDLEVLAVEGTELVKGTGGPRCMTRPIYMA